MLGGLIFAPFLFVSVSPQPSQPSFRTSKAATTSFSDAPLFLEPDCQAL
jgi:hypothetical protein